MTKTLAEFIADLAVVNPNGATALTAWYEDGTIASVITALGLSGSQAATNARKIVAGAGVDLSSIVARAFAG